MSIIPGMGQTEVNYNEADAAKRRLHFYLENSGGSPVAAKAGEQPQISVNGGSWSATGIGVLVAVSSGTYGDYYADVTQAVVATDHAVIRGRFKDGDTVECRSLNTLSVGGEIARRTAVNVNKVKTERDSAETKVYEGDGTTVWYTRKRQAAGDNAVEIVVV
jgi:hypothetical protein